MVVFDVDGTLRDRDGMPESAREALWRLKRKGVTIALATGRNEYEIRPFMEEFEIDWAITCNGSHIGYRGQRHELILFGKDGIFLNQAEAPLFRQAQQEIDIGKLLEHLKLTPDEVAAFGDSANDLEMMELVGTAIAMGNGTDELKKKATYVTKPLHDGGIAHAVDRCILV